MSTNLRSVLLNLRAVRSTMSAVLPDLMTKLEIIDFQIEESLLNEPPEQPQRSMQVTVATQTDEASVPDMFDAVVKGEVDEDSSAGQPCADRLVEYMPIKQETNDWTTAGKHAGDFAISMTLDNLLDVAPSTSQQTMSPLDQTMCRVCALRLATTQARVAHEYHAHALLAEDSRLRQTWEGQPEGAVPGRVRLQCAYCNRQFSNRFTLKRHQINFRCRVPYQCPTCPESFRYPSELSRHARHFHPWLKPFVCKFCPKAFTTRRLQTKHQSVKHKQVISTGNETTTADADAVS